MGGARTAGAPAPASASASAITLDVLVQSWARHLCAANLSPRTIRSYTDGARQFIAFAAARGIPTDADARRPAPAAAGPLPAGAPRPPLRRPGRPVAGCARRAHRLPPGEDF